VESERETYIFIYLFIYLFIGGKRKGKHIDGKRKGKHIGGKCQKKWQCQKTDEK
jgi:hypothetical protein